MNKERLVTILEHIKARPWTYDQTTYHSECGSKHCIAGFAELAFDRTTPNLRVTPPGDINHIFSKAKYYLKLTVRQATYLFHCSRTMEQIEAFVENGGEVP